MNIHKNTRLTLKDREELWSLYCSNQYSINQLSRFRVSRQTISKILQICRKKEFIPRNSSNNRFKAIKYGLKRLKKD